MIQFFSEKKNEFRSPATTSSTLHFRTMITQTQFDPLDGENYKAATLLWSNKKLSCEFSIEGSQF
jgi:hypothetical protein